jgi:acetyl esterase/lipase
MKNNLFLSLLSFFCLFGIAKGQTTVSLYDGEIPNSNHCIDKEVSASTGRKVVRNVTIPTLTIFVPKSQNASRSAIIICPGGGYSNLSIQDGGFAAAIELAEKGIVSFVLKYRTADTICNNNYAIVPLQDVQQAIFKIKENAKTWNLDTNKIGLLGFSAGGHLVTTAATQYQHPQIENKNVSLRPAFTILAYPVISFTDQLTSPNSKTRQNLLGPHPDKKLMEWFSPEMNVDKNTPPAFLLHASDDSTSYVDNSISYYKALHHFNIAAEMVIYQNGGHGFATYNEDEDDHWIIKAVKWLKLNSFLD